MFYCILYNSGSKIRIYPKKSAFFYATIFRLTLFLHYSTLCSFKLCVLTGYMTKRELRIWIKDLRKKLPAEYVKTASEAICSNLEKLPRFADSSVILFFWPLDGEVDLRPLIEKCFQNGKTVLLPVVTGPSELELRRYCGPQGLVDGSFGVMEPVGQAWTGNVGFIVAPGLAFDAAGARIGYGKGYYDHLLEKHAESFTAGVCFSRMIVESVPVEPHDKRMDLVVTEKDMYRILN